MPKIKTIKARQILDSRGKSTVEAGVQTEQGTFRASVPSGVSCGKYEALAVPAAEAAQNIETIIAPQLRGKSFSNQQKIDKTLIKLDGTKNKSRLGANAILAVSIACCRAAAAANNLSLYSYIRGQTSADSVEVCPLPRPCFNILEGGKHAKNNLDIQEFMVVPAPGSFKENLQAGKEIYNKLKEILEKKFGKAGINTGAEAGFAPPLKETKQALDLVMEAIKQAGCEGKIRIGLDAAASEFYKAGTYEFEGKKRTAEELLKFYRGLIAGYPILFIEDPFAEDDWQGWQKITKQTRFNLGRSSVDTKKERELLVVGDDLTTTNPERISQAKKHKACNAIILKPNQIGTVTEVIEASKLAKGFDWQIVISHRAGETNDDFIADLAVGIGAEFIKSGAPSLPERMAKYNRLLQIEKEL